MGVHVSSGNAAKPEAASVAWTVVRHLNWSGAAFRLEGAQAMFSRPHLHSRSFVSCTALNVYKILYHSRIGLTAKSLRRRGVGKYEG